MEPLVTRVYLILLHFFPKVKPAYCKHGAETLILIEIKIEFTTEVEASQCIYL